MPDEHILSLVAKIGFGLLGIALLVHHWSGPAGAPGGNFFLNAAILMGLGLVLLADVAIDEMGLRRIAQLCGYASLAGIGIATVL
ncbi:MAG: hypothetical protein OEM49_02915 [Myxococcales bacterium]|nr:hypothetical protein [Myxococcales bacterium]MDH5306745.1 hypothetical protein [Myxococcales bacterium]MDH5565955.1 hypothetical protein [Myxococcales bacterium]